ncbi:MAG TPA: DUF2269 family protein, partial [Rhodospirillales bacterium]|nr:DUF2269 family protein [Rhodospirillales bacterium]
MDRYLWLRFAHLVGLMLMSAGLIGVFVADMRSRQVRDVRLFAQAITFIAVFYDGLVVPGALLLLASGTWLIAGYHGGWDFLEVPWLAGMVVLFAFEFIEGNTVTRPLFHPAAALNAAGCGGAAGHAGTGAGAGRAARFFHPLPRHSDPAGDRLTR